LVQVSQNLNGHCLHGGFNGFGKKIWSVMDAQCENGTAKLVLQYCSPHLEEGFPGNLSVTVTYSFDEYGKLTIMYTAQTDQDTAINLTSHPYFNLNGQDNSNILQHELYIDADYILEVDDQVLPTGHKISVEGTAFDFKNFKTLGENIHDQDIQLELANGYDHNFIVNSPGDLSRPKAILKSSNGRELRVFTTEPGIQLYTGNWLENVPGKNNFVYHQFGGVCLETQHFPDSPNQPHFPSTKLKSGEVFQSTTIYHPVA
jgi:aldose 1-epimerase